MNYNPNDQLSELRKHVEILNSYLDTALSAVESASLEMHQLNLTVENMHLDFDHEE